MKQMPDRQKKFANRPIRVICASFGVIILVGTLLLMLPFSTRSGVVTPFYDALFTATSATCVTGLVVYDTVTHWSLFGQGVILLLIQIGGLGLVTFTTFFNIMIGRKLGLRDMSLARESGGFESFAEVRGLIKFVIKGSLIIELCGALLLAASLVPEYGTPQGIWLSVFLSISAYCNAGFDLLGFQTPFASLTGYADDPWVLSVIMGLIVVGGIGFVVIHDLMHWPTRRNLMLHTRIVLIVTGVLLAVGFLSVLLIEWNNPATLGSLPLEQRPINALFQSVTFRTAGFNTINLELLHEPTKYIASLLMIIGAAPGSTGGGIKLTTVTVIIMTVYGVLRGQSDTIMLRRRVPHEAVYKALTVVFIAVLVVGLGSSIIYFDLIDDHPDLASVDVLFEQVSAFATVGLSSGVTALTGGLSKAVLIVSMFLGRVGPVSLALSLAVRERRSRREIIPDGKIWVG